MQNIYKEPDFNWWAKHVMHRRDRIISKVKQRIAKKYFKRKMKFWIEFPKTLHESMSLDKNNINTLWYDAIAKDIRSV